ncbi:MAG: sigma-70 family RNA polymerase sigma factor [Burkholderiaceae bacterium]|nr:sigma-70 family RNA polymerase sigma factor [Burkholderiaceae bacterium]
MHVVPTCAAVSAASRGAFRPLDCAAAMHDSQRLQADLARVALGDRAAFQRAYQATSAHLFGVAMRMLNRRDLAEDVLQEAFVNVWHHAGSYQAAAGQPMTWLISIVRNKCLDTLRSIGRRPTESLDAAGDDGEDDAAPSRDIEDDRPNPMQLLGQACEALQIKACMDGLDASHRQCLALAYYHGMSHSEVAEHICAPLGSVKAWVRRGLDKLKACLDRAGVAA